MSKSSKKPGPPAPPAPSEQAGRQQLVRKDGIRETVESIVIAFVLAFLFRTFEAEAFVIPTGSMAPTLMGRHKDVTCPECGYAYQASSSDELERGTDKWIKNLISTTCPLCRHTIDVDVTEGGGKPSYKGDRIIVGKFAYALGEPQRWDIGVFKFPGRARDNYIKRFVGLPEETIRIHRGDVLVRESGADRFEIARKPLDKLEAMLQVVDDNDYLLDKLLDKGWPPHWQVCPLDLDELVKLGWPNQRVWPSDYRLPAGGWTTEDGYRGFSTSGSSPDPVWIRYQHILPPPWTSDDDLASPSPDDLRPQLVPDFYAYNAGIIESRGRPIPVPPSSSLGLHWVGDLAMECELTARQLSGEAILELVEGGRRFQCRFDLSGAKAWLEVDGQAMTSAAVSVTAATPHKLLFANVDDRLALWIDGQAVEFDGPTTYSAADLNCLLPKPADLSPAGIASKGAAIEVAHLRVLRDVYYIAVRGMSGEYADYRIGDPRTFLSSPEQWGEFSKRQFVDFPLAKDQFLALGDNSPKSADSRMWGREYFVKRELLIGKAMYIYWPHGWEEVGNTGIPMPIHIWPNFKRMELIE